jgi:CBS domain-containing protein
MKAKHIMTRDPAVCSVESTLADVARTMWDEDVGFLPVVDQRGDLVGTITDRDACMAAYTQGKPLSAISVQLAMAKTVVSCREDDDLDAVHVILRRCHIRRLPVLDVDGRMVGVLSIGDLAAQAVDGSASGPRSAVTLTFAQVSRPRSRPLPSVPAPRGARQARGRR